MPGTQGTFSRALTDLHANLEKSSPGNGCKVLVFLVFAQFFFRSAVLALVLDSWVPLHLRKGMFSLSCNQVNFLYALLQSRPGIETITAVLSDSLPIRGYHWRWHMVIGLSVCIMGLFRIAGFEPPQGLPGAGDQWSAANGMVSEFFMFSLGYAAVCTLIRPQAARLVRAARADTLAAHLFFLANGATVFSAWNLLLPADDGNVDPWRYKVLIYLAIPCCIPSLMLAVLNWMVERPDEDTSCRPRLQAARENPSLFKLSLVIWITTATGMLVQWNSWRVWGIDTKWLSWTVYLGGAVIILICCKVWLEPTIANAAIFIFVSRSLFLRIDFVLHYWYIADRSCFTSAGITIGPDFDNSLYQMLSGYSDLVTWFASAYLFHRFVQHWNVVTVFWWMTIGSCIVSLFELVIVERWDQKLFGLDPNGDPSYSLDVMFLVLSLLARKSASVLHNLPVMLLIFNLVPTTMGRQVMAVLTSVDSLGTILAYISGSLASEALGISFSPPDLARPGARPGGWDCENPARYGISSLGWLLLLSCAILRLAVLPLCCCLLPQRAFNEKAVVVEATQTWELATPTSEVQGSAAAAWPGSDLDQGPARSEQSAST